MGQTESRTAASRAKTGHLLINTSLWSFCALSGLLLGIAILLSSCAVYPAEPATTYYQPYYEPYYQPYYVQPYYAYPRTYFYYGPRYRYYDRDDYGCHRHCR